MKQTNQVRRWSGPDPVSVSLLSPKDQLPMSSQHIFAHRLDSHGVARILHDAVDGDYTFEHRLVAPHVTVRPSDPQGSITVHTTPGLHLQGDRRTIWGPDGVLDLAVWFMAGQEYLMEVGLVPIGQQANSAVVPRPKMPRIVAPNEPAVPAVQPDRHEPLPAALEAICTREGVDRQQGDYVVVPEAYLPGVSLPDGIVRSALVTDVHVVQPRLGVDKAVKDVG